MKVGEAIDGGLLRMIDPRPGTIVGLDREGRSRNWVLGIVVSFERTWSRLLGRESKSNLGPFDDHIIVGSEREKGNLRIHLLGPEGKRSIVINSDETMVFDFLLVTRPVLGGAVLVGLIGVALVVLAPEAAARWVTGKLRNGEKR